ncbi:uncharacterized protein N7479_009549 [Penicillium vulpinum]|uniref:Uncharacterized protein n=1 Tax=Penicillium vulpinum TaxID=29845 RepID=A0A1V6RZ18_9EURO|nr:uncharacterized protein N7479_009549 [Penicillium vulpinum]KAJ5951136.1 hypothetical protein N7479_009549 [Penicillium vulpinum]OQE06858.1 hypothetical protein PENVUL_c016G06066 [Penicillium vulpinum]
MASNNTDHRAGDTADTPDSSPNSSSDSQTTNTGQRAILTTKDLDANNIDSNDKVDIKIDLDNADVRPTPETQASNLPKLTEAIITNVPRRLKTNSKNLDQWVFRVKFALAQIRLEHLINSSVPHPVRGQHNYNRWVQWSRTVANWLYLHVDERIQDRLKQLPKAPNTADAVFDGIMKIVHESDKVVKGSVKLDGYDDQKISDLQAIRKYITAHQTPCHLLGLRLLAGSSLR